MSINTINIPAGQTVSDGVELTEPFESLLLKGTIDTNSEEPGVLTQGLLNSIEVAPNGEIFSQGTAIQIEGVATVIGNFGNIFGGFNGINIANGDTASALIFNYDTGVISSDSRAVNIGGVGGRLVNFGKILSTANPRNGTVYGDVTAQNVFIDNLDNGVIDVGAGNDGDAISLELGADVNGGIYNEGLIQGRGLPGVENPDNQAAGVRLYWVEASGADTSIFNGDIVNSGIIAAENNAAVIIEDRVQLNGDIINSGLIQSANPVNGDGIQLENGSELTGTIINSGVINGGFNGVNFGNGGQVVGRLLNTGLITSTSRAVNIGGFDVKVVNEGNIITSESPRDGVIYADQTAVNFEIINRGLVDVGAGNDGDAISLELGAEVNGSVVNSGVVRGRGLPAGELNNQNNQASAVRLYWGNNSGAEISVFNGDIDNSGILSAENGAAVIVEDRVKLNGEIINTGIIEGGVVKDGQLAIDANNAEDDITVLNQGIIRGDVLLSAGDDLYDGALGRVFGTVYGNGGADILTGGQFDDLLNGGTGNDELLGNGGKDTFQFGSDLLDGIKDTDIIKDFAAGDTFDFSEYLAAGGEINFSLGQGELLVDLNQEDLVTVQGDIFAAEQSLLDITGD